MLRTIANLNVITKFTRSLLNRQNTSQEFQQGRLTGAIRADENSPLASLYDIIYTLVHHIFAIGIIDSVELDYFVSATFRLGETESHAGHSRIWQLDLVHPLDLFPFAL